MGQPAARKTDPVIGTDMHILMVPSPGGPVPTPTPLPFNGTIMDLVSSDVLINGLPAATKDSVVRNVPPHIAPPPATFQKPPTDQGTVLLGSQTVLVNGKPLARVTDKVMTCNDPADAPMGTITGGSPDVLVG